MTSDESLLVYQISKFWRWWAEASPRIHAGIVAGRPSKEYWAIGFRLGRLDGKLLWEITAGTTAEHRLIVRPLGDPDRRYLVGLLLAAGPPADAIWEYAAARLPNPIPETLEIGSVEGELVSIDTLDDREELEEFGVTVEQLALAEMRLEPTWDADFERADIRFWHPKFGHLDPAEAFEIGRPAIAALLGDEDELRWLGDVRADPNLRDGMPLPELRPWLDRHTETATGVRWVTERRRDQRKRHVAVRFNAAQKSMDLPPKRSGLSVVLQRTVADVEAPETQAALGPLADLVSTLDPATVRVLEVSESKRLTVFFISADAKADRKATRAWEKRQPKVDADFEVKRRPKWTEQMRLGELGRGRNVPWEAAPTIRTRGDGRLYRRARWIERNPRRLLMGPLLTAVGALILAISIPSASREAALLLIGVAGVLIAIYRAASTYVTLRNNAALGILALLFDGWGTLVILGFSLVLIIVYFDEMLSP